MPILRAVFVVSKVTARRPKRFWAAIVANPSTVIGALWTVDWRGEPQRGDARNFFLCQRCEWKQTAVENIALQLRFVQIHGCRGWEVILRATFHGNGTPSSILLARSIMKYTAFEHIRTSSITLTVREYLIISYIYYMYIYIYIFVKYTFVCVIRQFVGRNSRGMRPRFW